MKADGDKIILESRREIDLLQNSIEIAFASKDANEDEKAVAKELSGLLESMYYSW